MKVVFRKETKLEIYMEELLEDCIDRLDHAKERAKRNRFTPDYEDLESLVQESLEFIYDIDFYDYDNTNEIVTVVAKNLLLWCLENDFIEEHSRLEEMC